MWEPQPILPPWKGVVDNVPSIVAPTSSFASATGFWIDKQRLKSIPQQANLAGWSTGYRPLIGARSFVDAVGDIHTVLFSADQAQYYVNGVFTSIIGANPSLVPITAEVYQNVLFFTNGNTYIAAIDGSANALTDPLLNNGTSYFLGKLAGRLLALNLVEPIPSQAGSTAYPRRVRWSAENNGFDWSSYDAGVFDISEIEDNITGYATQGALGYVYHSQGISVMTPTGGISPTFFVENYSEGDEGIGPGNYYPYSLAQYGNMTCFAAIDYIYMFNPLVGPLQPIGGTASRSIYIDLFNSTSYAIGAMVPSFGSGISNLQYWLAIPFSNNTSRIWMYSFDSQTWMAQMVPFNVTCMSNIAID